MASTIGVPADRRSWTVAFHPDADWRRLAFRVSSSPADFFAGAVVSRDVPDFSARRREQWTNRHVRWQKLGAAEMLPLRINAGGEVHLIFGLPDLEGVVLGQPVVVAESGKSAV